MFKIVKSDSFKWPVKVLVPANGRHVEQSFTGEFRTLDRERVTQIGADGAAETDFLREAFIGWEGVADENGTALDFSDAARDQLLNIVYVRNAVIEAFFAGIAGRRAKN